MTPRFWLVIALLPPALLGAAGVTSAQVAVSDVTREIDAQVWVPMLRASDQFDAEGFLAVQSAELIRVSVDRNEVYDLDRYAGEIRAGFARARERKLRRTSTLRFLTRTHSGGLARDTGIFRSEVVLASGETRVSYTAFEMILRKEDGRWKLLLDQDAGREGTITEQDYLKGTPLASGGVVPAAPLPTPPN